MTETLMLTHVNIITLVSAIGHMTLAGICICFPRLPSLFFLRRCNNVSTIFPCSNSSEIFHWVFPTITTLTPSQGANVRILPASKYIYPNSIFQDWENNHWTSSGTDWTYSEADISQNLLNSKTLISPCFNWRATMFIEVSWNQGQFRIIIQ